MKRKLMILSIFLVALLAVSAASATDNATDDIASVDETTDEVVILSENNDIGTFDDLQSEINNAQEGSVLNLTRDYNGAVGSRIQLNKNLNIDGQGHTLDCLGKDGCSAFYSNSGTITLKNLIIINGHNDFNNKGGAIHIEGSAQYTIINCTFNNNWADDYGGAIYNDVNKPLTIINSSFYKNAADDDDGGAIYSKGELDIKNSTFTSNNAEDNGGAIYCEKSVTVDNSAFEKNHAKVDGGAIYSKNTVNVKNTRFSGNEAKGASSSQCYGGAIRSEGNVKVDYSNFTENIAADYGGAIYAKTASISSSRFIKNNAEDDNGGAVYVEESVDVEDSYFYKNEAKVDGGAIFSKNSVNVNNTGFSSNSASYSGADNYGGAIRGKGNIKIEGSLFNNNYVGQHGSAIYCDGDLDIKNTKFTSNTAQYEGGAVYCVKSVTVNNCEFADNRAFADGGAIYCKKDVIAKNTIFRNNMGDDLSLGDGQDNDGGAILSKGDVKIDNCTFIGNHARDYGGAIKADTITWVDSPSYFKDNYVNIHDGGAIYVNKFNTDVKYGVFINNYIGKDVYEYSRDAGAIYINKENHITFSHCYFENNRCTDEGGAIYLDSTSSTLTLEDNIFVDNTAKDKGNIVYNKGKYTKIYNNWYGSNTFDFSNQLVEYNTWGSDKSHKDDKPVTVELSLNENPQAGQPSTLIVTFISDGELFNYDAKFSADNGAILTNHKTGNNTVTSDITFDDGITTVTATVNHQALTLSYSYTKENVTMDINVPEIIFGDNATVNVILTPGNATGKVSIGDISSTVVNGTATVIIPDLSAGNHTLLVSYSGDGVYKAKQENVTITVNRGNLNIDASAKPIVKGENATVIVTGLERATGNVNVTINNNNWTGEISNGTATIIIPGLNENTTANVTYPGDANYINASTTVDIIVNPVKMNLTIIASAEPIMVSEDAIVVVTGLENATGNVTVTIGSDKWYGEINNGAATVIVTGLKQNATAGVFYAGDYLYNNATTTVNITVNPIILVWYVNGNKKCSGNGTTPETAFITLKEALNKAPEDSTIYIAPGTYTGENNTNLTINKTLTLVNYGAGEVIFDAQGLSRIWTVNAERINIKGLTFKNGKEQYFCGAIFFNQTLDNSYINAIFIDNTVVDGLGGAIGFYADVINTDINSIFINNHVDNGYGGAIFFNGNLNNVNIGGNYTANTASDYGGAILFNGDLSNVNISGKYTANTADDGGAIFFNGNLIDVNINGHYNNNQANDTAGVFLFSSNLTNVVISGDYSNNVAQYCAVYYMSEFTTITDSSITGDYYDNSANYCVVLLIEGSISNSNISGDYTNNHAKKGINIIGDAHNVKMSGNYMNNDISNGSAIYIMYCDENSVIHDSIFINNTIDDELIIYLESGSLLSANNWFGNNASNYNIKPKVSENVNMANWLFLNATTNTTGEITINEASEITFKLYSYDDVSQEIKEYDASKMNIQLDLSQKGGTLNQTTAFINETILYTYKEVGVASVTGKFETASYTIVLAKHPTEIIIDKTEITLKTTESVSAGATLNPPEAGGLTYTSSNTTVAVVENGIIKGLTDGTTIITVSFAGNEEYAPAVSKNITVRVEKRIPVIIASADVTENRVTIQIDIDGYDGVISLNSIYLSINSSLAFVEILDPGSYSINITALGNELFYSGSEILDFTIPEPEKLNTSISAQSNVDGNRVTITVDVDANATGFVEIAVAGNKYYVPVDKGTAVFTNDYSAGTYSADITYLGDNKYNPANTTDQFSVIEQNKTLENTSIEINVITGENYAMFTVDVNESATGFIEINIDGDATYLAVNNGHVTYEVVMPGGNYTVTATYLGDDRFNGNSTSCEFTVKDHEKVNTTITTSVNVDESTVTLTVNVNESATGFVEIAVAGNKYYVPVDAGTAIFTNDYSAGTYTADITYLGDDNFNIASDSATFTIIEHNETKMNTTINVEVKSVENNVTITVKVNENATGLVEFNIDGDAVYLPVNNGIAECGFLLPGGDYTVTATYMGDAKFNSIATSKEFTVKDHEKQNTTITTSVNVDESTATLTVNVNESATGFVEISIAGKKYYVPVETGKAVFSNDYLPGTYTANIIYLGDDNFNIASDSISFTIIEHNETKIDTTIDIEVESVENNVTITVNVNENATGLVEFNIDGDAVYLPVNNGVAKCGFLLPAGNYTITATYLGDAKFNSNVTSKEFTVKDHKKQNATISVEATSPVAGENATVTVTLPADATGTVEVKYGNGIYIAPVVDGTAVVSVPTAIAGTETASVTYSGDTNYDPVSTEVNITVKPQGKIIAEDIKRGVNSSYDYYATLVNAEGQPISDVEITFTIDGKTYKAKTNASGIATVSAGLEVVDGKDTVYDVTVTNPYTKENTTATTTIVPRLIVVSGDLTADYLENPPYIVQAIGDDGEHVGANVTVRIVFAGFYYDLKTNETGHVVRTIGLAPGSYAVRGEYLGYKTEQTPFQVLQILQASSGTLKKTAKSYTLKATLKHTNGKAISGQTVKLIFNGKTYTAKTNSKGVVSYTIKSSVINKLKAGKTYILKAQYVNDITKGKWQGKIKVVKK